MSLALYDFAPLCDERVDFRVGVDEGVELVAEDLGGLVRVDVDIAAQRLYLRDLSRTFLLLGTQCLQHELLRAGFAQELD